MGDHSHDPSWLALERASRRLSPPPPSVRSSRYRGDDLAVPLSAMTHRDRAAIRTLYAMLEALAAALRPATSGPGESTATRAALDFDLDTAFAAARSIGGDTGPLPDDVRRALHDARGGALTSLLVELNRARARPSEEAAKALTVLVSDHLKVMRNAILELDDVRRGADLAPCPHSVARLAESLGRVTSDRADGQVRVEVRCSFVGTITMSCVELGALDRVALNLVNNAVRHAATSPVIAALAPASPQPGADLRVVVANRIDDRQADVLRARFGDEVGRLWTERFTTTGSGDGLKICLDFVTAAYGLARGTDAARAGLVGATMEDGHFIAWIHWPAVV